MKMKTALMTSTAMRAFLYVETCRVMEAQRRAKLAASVKQAANENPNLF